MGYALAAAASALGARTILISGPTSLTPPTGVDLVRVETTQQMYQAVSKRFARVACLIMAAAPSDYKPASIASSKLKKSADQTSLILKPTIDILKTLSKRKKPGQLLVGFALETDNGLANARKKLKEKNLDLIVLNETSASHPAFESDSNKITLLAPRRKPEVWPLQDKARVAAKLLEKIAGML